MNLIEALTTNGVAFKPHQSRDGEIYLCCPFCVERHESPDHRFRLSVNYLTGLGHCYNCGWSSRDAVTSLSYALKMGQLDAVANPHVSQARPDPTELPKEFVPLYDVDEGDMLLWNMKKYLLERGVTQDQIEKKNIGCALEGRWAHSILFPVHYPEVGLCGWISRDITGNRKGVDGKLLRYLNSDGVKKLYNVPCPVPKGSTIVLSEGIFKALAIERCFGPRQNWYSVSCQGHGVTNEQLPQLKGAKEIVMFCDPDYAGVNGFLSAASSFRHLFQNVSIAYPLPVYQADELPKDKIIDHLRNRRGYTVFLEQKLKVGRIFGNRELVR